MNNAVYGKTMKNFLKNTIRLVSNEQNCLK